VIGRTQKAAFIGCRQRPKNKEVFLLKKSEKILKTKLKGAVLLLVMTVMFMLMILLMATLAVVSNTNKKAYVKFEENQAYYTAASALEVFWNGGVLTDSQFYAVDGAIPKNYVNVDGTTATGKLTQGRDLELELYKLVPVDSIGSIPNLTNKLSSGSSVNDLVKYVEQYNSSLPKDGMGGDTAGKYGEQFQQPSGNPPTALAYYVEFPDISSPSTGDFGRYADLNPYAGSSGAPQLASIKIEVIERYYDLAGVPQADLENFLKDTDTDPTTNPVPNAIAEDVVAPAVASKIDTDKLADALKAGDRAKDTFKVRITSESVLMGVKGSAAVELKTGTAVVSAPQGDTAIKSFGFSEDGSTGYGAIGGASGLADVAVSAAMISGVAYSEGNLSFQASAYMTAENSMRYSSGPRYIETKPHLYAKSWISNKANQTYASQSEEFFFYAGKGFRMQDVDFASAASAPMNFITNGTFYNTKEHFPVTGNLVEGERGRATTQLDSKITYINDSAYVRDLYLDDLTAAGDSLEGNSFGVKNDYYKVGTVSGDNTLYVKDIYLNFPADQVKDPVAFATAAGNWNTTGTAMVNSANPTYATQQNTFGYYDYNNNQMGYISPYKTKADTTDFSHAKWLINTRIDGTSGFDKIVFSGKVYFRDYNGTANPDNDKWVGWEWDDLNGTDNSNISDDWFWFVNLGAGQTTLNSFYTGTGDAAYYTVESSVNNGLKIIYADPNDSTDVATYYAAGTDSEFAWDINTDVTNAVRGTYTDTTLAAPADAGTIYFTQGPASPKTPEVKFYNTNGETAKIQLGITDPTAAPYSFDTEDGYVWLRMPFITSDGSHTARAIMKFDTPQSLYKEYFDPGTPFVTAGEQPVDGDNNGYMTYDPSKGTANPDVLGYGMLKNAYVGPFTYNTGTKTYTLAANTAQPNNENQWRKNGASNAENFGYIIKEPTNGDGSYVYGIRELIASAEEKVGAAAFAMTNVVFDDNSVPTTSLDDMTVEGRSIMYTKNIATDGVVKRLSNAEPFNNMQMNERPSLLNIVDASTPRTIYLEPSGAAGSKQIAGTFIVNGDSPTNFIIPGGQGTVRLGNTQSNPFNIISSKNLKYFTVSPGETSGSRGGTTYRFSSVNSPLGRGGSTVKTGSNETDKATSSFITLYVGAGTDIRFDSGTIDGTVYAPDSFVDLGGTNQATNLKVTFNGAAPANRVTDQHLASVLGTIVCGTIKFNANELVVFVAPDADNTPPAGLPQFTWNPVAYTANAAGS
jgi:hypothetical protein